MLYLTWTLVEIDKNVHNSLISINSFSCLQKKTITVSVVINAIHKQLAVTVVLHRLEKMSCLIIVRIHQC